MKQVIIFQSRLSKSILKQTTLDTIVTKLSTEQSKIEKNRFDKHIIPAVTTETDKQQVSLLKADQRTQDAIYCTQREYITQSTKVSNLRTNLKRLQVSFQFINMVIADIIDP